MEIKLQDLRSFDLFKRNCGLRERSLTRPRERAEDKLEGGREFYILRGVGMTNKQHFKGRSMEFVRGSGGGKQNSYINLRGGDENSTIYMRTSSRTLYYVYIICLIILKAIFENRKLQ